MVPLFRAQQTVCLHPPGSVPGGGACVLTSTIDRTMTELRERAVLLSRIRWLRGWRGLILLVATLGAAAALAQVIAPPVPPPYCYSRAPACHSSLDEAEAAIRADPYFQGAGDAVEHVGSFQVGATLMHMQYRLRDRPAESIGTAAYWGDFGSYGNSQGKCALSDDQVALPGWCASEDQVIGLAQDAIRLRFPTCLQGAPRRVRDYFPPYLLPVTDTVRGTIDYKYRYYEVDLTCTDGGSYTKSFFVLKQRPMYCRTGFKSILGDVLEEFLAQDYLCQPRQGQQVTILTSIQQCGSCAGSENPVYPATGEKRRAEPDFEFAGTTFTRHYRSLRQFRNNSRFAVAWTHTWSDRIISTSLVNAPFAHIDETGDYESYRLIAGSRHRGENSRDRILERVNADGIGWRLRLPDGELREFDTAGFLIAVRHPDAPQRDIVITHVRSAVATVTDAQGRSLRFEYGANLLLRRIHLPDGTAIAYGYDGRGNLVDVTYPDAAVRRYHYNEPGLAGAPDQRHHLTGITAEDGRRFASFSYDARGRTIESRVLGAPNEVTTVAYPDEYSATVSNADGGVDRYTFEPSLYRRILSRSDHGGSAGLQYDGEGRLFRSTDKRSTVTEYAYQDGLLTATTEAVGTAEQRRHEVDRDPSTGFATEHRIRDRSGALVARSSWTYNARGQIVAETVFDPATGASRTETTAYCEQADVDAGRCPIIGQVRSIDGALPGAIDVSRFEYRMADAPGCAVSAAACSWRRGDLWKTINPLGHVVEVLASDPAGRVLSLRDENGVVTDVEYDERGRTTAQKVRGGDDSVEFDDQISRIEYDPTGTVRRMVLPDGVQTRFEYDAAQRLTRIIDGLGNTLDFTLNPAGEVVGEHTRDAAGMLLRTLTRTYDTLGRLQAVRDADFRSTTFVHEEGDLLQLETDALGRKTRYTYDALGRLRTSLQDVEGLAARSEQHYDALDRIVRVTDPNGLHTDTTYNGFGEITALTSPDTGTSTATYEAAGRLLTRTDARGITATYAYDALDRVIAVAYPDASLDHSFAYDTAPAACPVGERFHIGRLARMTDASGETAYCYDRFGHLTRKLQTTAGRTFAVGYDYTPRAGDGNGVLLRPRPAAGHLMALTYPDGAQVRIDRNPLRETVRLTVTLADGRVQTLLQDAVYYPFGPAARWTYGNGRTLARSLNRDYLPGYVEDTRPGGLSEGYWFDAVGNLESLRRADQTDPPKRRYVHDRLDRLTEVRDGATGTLLQDYDYDSTGNRTQSIGSGVIGSYAHAPGTHRLVSAGSETRSYDAAGNTTRIETAVAGGPGGGGGEDMDPGPGEPGHPGPGLPPGDPPPVAESFGFEDGFSFTQSQTSTTGGPSALVREFVYDDTGRMRQVLRDGAVAMDYRYNAKGERVHRSGSGETVVTVYDEAGRWLGDYTAAGQPIQQAIWLDDLPVGLLVGAGSAQTLYYLQPDALGSARVAIDSVRDVAVWRWDLTGDVFGASAPNEDPDGDGVRLTLNLRFPGQQYDAATGLHYNYYRDYDPTVGRYVQSDPIGLLGGMSTYGYANLSPGSFTDPLGLKGKGLGGRIGQALFSPIYQRLGGGAAARAASMAAKARSEARRAADMAKRMRTVLGRIFKDRSKKGAGPAGCDSVATRNPGEAASRYQFERLKADLAQQELLAATPTGSALKGSGPFSPRTFGRNVDMSHASPTFARETVSQGRHFTIRGGDGVYRNLSQVPGSINGQRGIFEFIVGPEGLTHQRFIANGRITGFPNQPVPLP
jgi:RHS repeat-associated protein